MRANRIVVGVLATLLVGAAAACVHPRARILDPVDGAAQPRSGCDLPAQGQDFEWAAAEQVGLDPDVLEQAVDYATATGARSVRVYRHGCLVGEGGLEAGSSDERMAAFSMTKSVVALAVGRAEALGLIGTEDPVGPYLEAAGFQVDETKGALTVRHFLTQTTGIRMSWVADIVDGSQTDSVQALLRRPFEAVPGTKFIYGQTTVTALAAVVEGATGRDFQDFVREELFEEVGIGADEWRWARDPAGNTQGMAFLDMTPRAFARLGYLAARSGRWEDRQLIGADFMARATEGTTDNPCYGFLMRSNRQPTCANDGFPSVERYDRRWLVPAPEDTFGFSGAFDQETTIYPGLGIVVVRMGYPGQVFPDPIGEVAGQKPKWQYRFARMLMASVRDRPQPAVPDWRPDPVPGPADIHRLLPLPLPEPWPAR